MHSALYVFVCLFSIYWLLQVGKYLTTMEELTRDGKVREVKPGCRMELEEVFPEWDQSSSFYNSIEVSVPCATPANRVR